MITTNHPICIISRTSQLWRNWWLTWPGVTIWQFLRRMGRLDKTKHRLFLIFTNHISKERNRNAVWKKSLAKRVEQKIIAHKNFAWRQPYSQANGFHHHPLLPAAFFMIRSKIVGVKIKMLSHARTEIEAKYRECSVLLSSIRCHQQTSGTQK